jgi:hypothetical protein
MASIQSTMPNMLVTRNRSQTTLRILGFQLFTNENTYMHACMSKKHEADAYVAKLELILSCRHNEGSLRFHGIVSRLLQALIQQEVEPRVRTPYISCSPSLLLGDMTQTRSRKQRPAVRANFTTILIFTSWYLQNHRLRTF